MTARFYCVRVSLQLAKATDLIQRLVIGSLQYIFLLESRNTKVARINLILTLKYGQVGFNFVRLFFVFENVTISRNFQYLISFTFST